MLEKPTELVFEPVTLLEIVQLIFVLFSFQIFKVDWFKVFQSFNLEFNVKVSGEVLLALSFKYKRTRN
jgi:hypothetical protein